MMLIICDKEPRMAAEYLIQHTSKNFIFKSLLELAQLISSTDISNVYKPVKQGKFLKSWIKRYTSWTFRFYGRLLVWCMENIKLQPKTTGDLWRVLEDLSQVLDRNFIPKTAIFRYKKGYESEYESNSELDIEICCQEYKKYLEYKGEQFNEKRNKNRKTMEQTS